MHTQKKKERKKKSINITDRFFSGDTITALFQPIGKHVTWKIKRFFDNYNILLIHTSNYIISEDDIYIFK
jgi:hypothetical protein